MLRPAFLLSLILVTHFAFATYTTKWIHYPGTIMLANGDSLKGDVLLYEVLDKGLFIRNNYLGFIEQYKDRSSEQEATWIMFKKISWVKVYPPGGHYPVVTFVNLSYKKTLWRVVLKNDSSAIYSDNMMPEYPLSYAPRKMILVTRGSGDTRVKITKLYTETGWFFHDSRTRSLLKHFINRHYHQHFKKSDFVDEEDELHYILAHA